MLLSYPMSVEKQSMDIGSIMSSATGLGMEAMEGIDVKEEKVYVNEAFMEMVNAFISQSTSNNLQNFKKYIHDNQSEFDKYCNDIQFKYSTDLNIYKSDTENGVVQVNPSTMMDSMSMGADMEAMTSMAGSMAQMSVWMELIGDERLMESQYDVIAGKLPENYNEVVLIVDANHQINELVVYGLGLKNQEEFSKNIMSALASGEKLENADITEYSYDQILDMEFKLVNTGDYFVKDKETGLWKDNRENDYYVKKLVDEGLTIKVVGILKPDEDNTLSIGTGGIGYMTELMDYAVQKNMETTIVQEQLNDTTTDVITGMEFSNLTVNDFDLKDIDLSKINFDYLDITPFLSMVEQMEVDMSQIDMTNMMSMFGFDDMSNLQKKLMEGFLTADQVMALKQAYVDTMAASNSLSATLEMLGYSTEDSPSAIYFYPSSFEDKEKLNELIDYYNTKVSEEGHEEYSIKCTDLIGVLMSSITTIIDIVTYVLVAFVAISLVVSSIMIGIITYISVLERTKEIGILRSIGASKKDIARVFNAETTVIGLGAGLIGIGTTLLLQIPINLVLNEVLNIPASASLPFVGGFALVIISVTLTLVAGLFPSRIAAKKDPVEALRTE